MRNLILIASLFVLSACQTVQTAKPIEVVTPIQETSYKAAWDHLPDAKKWTEATVAALDTYGADMLAASPKDAAKYCSKLKGNEKAFYVYLVSSMTKFESAFKPATTYTEGFNDAKGKPVVSRGLLQISIESANSYGCGFKTTEELHDPAKNLTCSVRILNRWIGRDQNIGTAKLGGARYWSVLRDSSGSQPKIKAMTLAFCAGF